MTVRRQLATFGWGVFCASSWTWCIGMYLPVLMVRHFGWPGVVVFALPNVAGCAAFGYIFRTRSDAHRLTQEHRLACGWFSLVTVAFHLFFAAFVAAYLIPGVPSPFFAGVVAAIALYAIGVGLSRLPKRAWPTAAVAAYAVSLVAFVVLGTEPLTQIGWRGDLDGWRLAFLAPTLAFGFLLCPYLDLTFHRALAHSPSRHAFAVFGIAFSVMILLTCAYWDAASSGLAVAAIAHVAAQSIFTVAVHLGEWRSATHSAVSRRGWPIHWVVFTAVPLALAPLAGPGSVSFAEGMYLRFLVFFGLVFPLYVVLFVNPWLRLGLTRRNLAIFAGSVLLAAPFYELGFLQEKTWYPLIPLSAILGGVALRWRVLSPNRRVPASLSTQVSPASSTETSSSSFPAHR